MRLQHKICALSRSARQWSYLFIACALTLGHLSSCKSEQEDTAPLLIGETTDSSEVSLAAQSERKIILRGGNKKYTASVTDPAIASVQIVRDTLKIKGLLEGRTLATIRSAEHTRQLSILIEPQDIALSKDALSLTPGEVSEVISISGGGLGLKYDLDNPELAIESVTINKQGRLVIKARHEGDATVRFSAEGKATQTLKLEVRQTSTTNQYGFYRTTHATPYHEMATPLIVLRRDKGYTLHNTAKPKSGSKRLFVALKEAPQAGEVLMLDIQPSQLDAKYQAGPHRFVVEAVSSEAIRLRGQGFRLILPRVL